MLSKRSLSPLIATILLIVVSVILIIVVLTWGSGFTKENTDKANTFLDSSQQISKSGVFWLDSLIGDKVILKNNLSSSVEIKGYKILTTDFNSEYFWLNSYRPLENNVLFTASAITPISLVCVPESRFFLELIDINDQSYSLEINPKGNRSYTKCNAFNVPLWEFETVSGSYTINTFSKQEGEFVRNGTFDTDSYLYRGIDCTVNDGKLIFNVEPPTQSYGYQVTSTPLINGKKYRVSFDVVDYSSGKIHLYVGGTTSAHGRYAADILGHHSVDFILTNNNDSTIRFYALSIYGFIGAIDNVSMVEIDPLETITDFTKYLQNNTSGIIKINSDQAYGTWEFDVKVNYGNRSYYHFISTDPSIYLSEGYFVVLNYYGDGQLGLAKSSNAGVLFGHLYRTSIGYLSNNFIYRIKVIRTKGNIFSLYIKGGLFGDEYSLVSVVGEQGSNPRFDNTYTKSNYFILSLSDGDFLANLKITPEIDQ